MVSTFRQNALIEWALRTFAIAAYVLMLLAIFNNWRVSGHAYSLLMLMVTEGFTLAIVLFAKSATRRDASPLLVFAVIYTSGYFLLFDSGETAHVIPDWAAAVLQAGGLGLTVISKATIGRAFGVLPAVRGLVTTGPYRVVRHPIYLGYMIGNAGFFLANASVRNALVLSALVLIQLLRIFREEWIFELSELRAAYDDYRSKVRFRLLPLVF